MQIREPEPVNILTAMTENEGVVKQETDAERRMIGRIVCHKPDRMSYADLVIFLRLLRKIELRIRYFPIVPILKTMVASR